MTGLLGRTLLQLVFLSGLACLLCVGAITVCERARANTYLCDSHRKSIVVQRMSTYEPCHVAKTCTDMRAAHLGKRPHVRICRE